MCIGALGRLLFQDLVNVVGELVGKFFEGSFDQQGIGGTWHIGGHWFVSGEPFVVEFVRPNREILARVLRLSTNQYVSLVPFHGCVRVARYRLIKLLCKYTVGSFRPELSHSFNSHFNPIPSQQY